LAVSIKAKRLCNIGEELFLYYYYYYSDSDVPCMLGDSDLEATLDLSVDSNDSVITNEVLHDSTREDRL
jgi:hypothetical protein